METNQIQKFLFKRLRREVLRELRASACRSGIMVADSINVDGIDITRYTTGPKAPELTGNGHSDGATLQQALRRQACRSGAQETSDTISLEEEVLQEMIADEINADLASDFMQNGIKNSTRNTTAGKSINYRLSCKAAAKANHALAHLVPPPRVSDAAVMILLSRAIRLAYRRLASLSAALTQRTPFVCIRVPIRGFEHAFARLLERGIFTQYPLTLWDGTGGYSLSKQSLAEGDPRASRIAIAFQLSALEQMGAEKSRQFLSRARIKPVPIIIDTEGHAPWPRRSRSAADVILEAPPLDWPMLADLIEICTNIPRDEILSAQGRYKIDVWRLGLDDLSLAIVFGRSLPDMLQRLEDLSFDNAVIDGDETEPPPQGSNADHHKAAARKSSGSSSAETSTRKPDKSKANIEIIQPESASRSGSKRKSSNQTILRVETLAGYGAAKGWALDLKADLALWRRKKLNWSDMSTKLLLSGPPGTGKTTFARALGNTLELPLLVTSVTHWLEPGYLGDVLKRISSIFEAAQEAKPIILFVDEFDGVGQRDGNQGRHYDDYWVSVINRVLERLDGALKSDGVIVVAATNRPDAIDPAIRRSGRLERHIIIPPPDLDALEGIFRHHLGRDLSAVLKSVETNVPSMVASTGLPDLEDMTGSRQGSAEAFATNSNGENHAQ